MKSSGFAISGEVVIASYLSSQAGVQAVPTVVEGRRVVIAFEPDASEHTRRLALSLGSILSRRVLHALWMLPHELRWPATDLDKVDLDTLRKHGAGLVDISGGTLFRVYQPPGRILALGVGSRRLTDAVNAVREFPPIYPRYAIGWSTTGADQEAVMAAEAFGIGALIDGPNGFVVRARTRPPEVGVPGVYRWWLAELAYGAWLQANIH